jgi:hypothetical protein
MSFLELWKSLCKKSQKLADGKEVFTFQPDDLKKLLQQFYDQGYNEGKKVKDRFDNIFKF